MSVATVSPPAAPIPIAVKARPPRARLLNALCEAGCEVICLLLDGVRHLTASRHDDKLHDQALATAARAAAINGQAAHVQGCGCAPAFDRIAGLIATARHHDGCEDALVDKGLALLVAAIDVVRAVNRRLEAEITKRGWRSNA